MTDRRSHPAVFAGLLGSAAWSVPTTAMASPLGDVGRALSDSLLLQFVVGCLAGAAVAGTASLIYERIQDSKGLDAEDDASHDESRWTSSSVDIARAQARAAQEEADDDPTGDLGRFRTGQITIDIPVKQAQAAERGEQKASRARHARHAKSPASAHVVAKRPTSRAGRHFSPAVKSEPAVLSAAASPKVPATRARHFATNTTPVPAPRPVQQPLEPQAAAAILDTPKADDTFAGLNAQLVEPSPIEPRTAARADRIPEVTPTAYVANGKAEDSTSGREAQVTSRLSIRERLAARTKNVREVLSARLGDDALAGVPVITRADGTSVDINPTWFDQTLAPVLASITGVSQKVEDTASLRPQVAGTATVSKAPAATVPGGSDRASYIARHVAEVNEGMFPERRSSDELDHKDAFEEALAAMGKTLGQTEEPNPAPVATAAPMAHAFHDVVGGPSTIDDPEGLEPPTGFIPFRVPAAHPEVVDMETYVDYLLRDELSNSGQEVLRRNKHAHLRVIEGGTSPLRMRRKAGDTGASKPARHFAAPSYAREA